MEETFIPQSDGRQVAGPEILNLGRPDTGVTLGKWCLILAGIGVVLAAGIFVGRATVNPATPTWQEFYQQRVLEGCLPQALVVGVGPQAQTDQLTEGNARAVSAVRSMYPDARGIESHLLTVPPTAKLRTANPRAEVVAYVTLERCLDGS